MSKSNWFNTLNEALESEGLLYTWDCAMPGINYDHTYGYRFDDGSEYGYYVSITRDNRGMYERPIHYHC